MIRKRPGGTRRRHTDSSLVTGTWQNLNLVRPYLAMIASRIVDVSQSYEKVRSTFSLSRDWR